MKLLKIFFGSLAGLWCLGILLKLLRNLPFIFLGPLGPSRLLGAVAGMILTGVLCYVCFRSALKPKTSGTNLEGRQETPPPIADPNSPTRF